MSSSVKPPYISLVSPVFNEEGNVVKLHSEILEVAQQIKKPFEIIFVNDGSRDNTLTELKKLKPIKIINLRSNSGQSAALDAGFKQAQGEIIASLDGDGQNDPADIPAMIKKLSSPGKNYDVVCGWRHKRQDSSWRKFISYGAKVLRSMLVSDGVHDAGCTLRVYKKDVIQSIDVYGEMHRMIPALLRWRGYEITEIKVNHRVRSTGQSKYGIKRTMKGFLDMLDVWFWRKYESRPLHLFGSAGLLLSGGSFLFGLYLGYGRLFLGFSLTNSIWPLIAVTGFITGMQLLVFGLLANLIIKGQARHKFYQISQIIEQ